MPKLKLPHIHIHLHKNGRLFGFGVSPNSDWKIILYTSIVLAIALIFLGLYMFIKINKGEIFVVERTATESAKTLDVRLLKKTVLYYQDRAARFAEIKAKRETIQDPSI